MFLSETALFAHVIFPAASFAEREGTFANTEKRLQRLNKAIEPVGATRPDWQIICDLARKLGSHGFDFKNSEEIMLEIASVTPQFENTSSHIQKDRFKFTPLQYRPPAEVSDIDYPLILITEKDVYSIGMLSRKVEGLNVLRANGCVQINPKDASDFGITEGEVVRVISRWGETEGRVKVTDTSPPGIITMSLVGEKINRLLNPTYDPIAKTLEIKMCAVKIVPQKESRL
jgi:predicted molibdopterin-dependent oxidoreductase YjgC